MTDAEIGRKVLSAFYKWSKTFYSTGFNHANLDAFLKVLQPNEKKLAIALDGIGGGVREAEISDSRIDSAMRSLALASKGKVPSNVMVFFNYLSNEATQINWVDAVAYTVTESVKDVATAAQSVGDSLITTGKILNFLLPVIILGGIYVFLDGKSGGRVTSTIKGFRK